MSYNNSSYYGYGDQQNAEAQHPYHPDDGLEEEENFDDNLPQTEFFQIFDGEEFRNVDSQIQTHLEQDLDAQLNDGFFASFLIYQYPTKNIKGNTSIFQTGTTARKNFQLQISQDNYLIVTYRIGKQKQQLHSQVKLKPNKMTHILLQLEQQITEEQDIHNSNSLTLLIDGVVQGQVALTKPIEFPNQYLFIGSEQLPVFKGEIYDMVFGQRPLNQTELDMVCQDKLYPLDRQRSTLEILEEYQLINHQKQQPQRKETQTAAQRHAIPQSLSKTHTTFIAPKQQEVPKEELKEEEILKLMMEESRQQLESLLLVDDNLNNKCRELSYAFRWVFNTLSMLSPPVEDKGGQCLPFVCLNNMIANDLVRNTDSFPYYGIELDRFVKVVRYANLPFTKDDIIQLAHKSNWLRRYKYKNDDNQLEQFDGIIYDKFMISVRNACMTPEEIRDIRKECGGDPHETAPKQGDEIEFDSYEEFLKICKRQEIPEEESKKFIYKGFSIRSAPFKGGKPRVCCTKDPRVLFYNKLIELYPDFKTNPATQEQAFIVLSDGDQIVHLDAFTQFCIYTLKLWGDQSEEEGRQARQQSLENTHTGINHNENLEECCKKLFNSFCFDNEPYFEFNHFVTILNATYPVVLYENTETGKIIEVSPYSSLPQTLVWAHYGSTVENDPNKQILGEITFKNDEEINFLSAQARVLQKQWVFYYSRDVEQRKRWNKLSKCDQAFGKWECQNEQIKLKYDFTKKQKLKFSFWKDDKCKGDIKFLVQDLLDVKSIKQGTYTKEWQVDKVDGKITIQNEITGTNGTQFLDYYKGGLRINLMAAIDWTASNKDVDLASSLHYFNEEKKQWNEYQQALKILGDALVPFDDDQMIPLYGFGCKGNFGGTPDCFPMNGNPQSPAVHGVKGILDTYKDCRSKVELSGPTVFSPVMSNMIKECAKKTQNNYSVALLFTDGQISDQNDQEKGEEISEFQKVENLIVQSSNKPVSFIIIGVGPAELSQFEIYNNYKEVKDSTSGKSPIRQNSLYINFTQDCKDREDLAQRILKKIKSQITAYYKTHKVTPENIEQLQDKTKHVLHLLHPEKYDKNNEDNYVEKIVKKEGKPTKVKVFVEPKPDFQPSYVPVSEDQEELNEEENPAYINFNISIQQTQQQNGDFVKIFPNEKLPEIQPQEYNFSQSFHHNTRQLCGIKSTMIIKNQVISEIPHDNFLTLNDVLIKSIAPLWNTEVQNYDFPQENQEDKEVLPKPCEQWNQGKFLVNLQRCADCRAHAQTSWHDETDFAEKQNEFTEMFKSFFPNIEIIANYEKPDSLECFEAYIRGVGPEHDRDELGKIQLFKKEEKLRSFLNNFTRRMLKPFDILVLLCSAYADSTEMEKVQQQWFKENKYLLPKKWENCTEGTCDVPERPREVEEQRRKDEQISTGTKMTCFNWACGQEYEYSEDKSATQYACTHHPGSYQMGSIHGYWPESWTCCRGKWDDPGCARGPHRGQQQSKVKYLCLSRGEVNPKTGRPDSCCGKSYSEDDHSECVIHSGYYKCDRKGDGYWTCCKGQGLISEPCATGSHTRAEWPQDNAKLYFVEKSQITDFRNEQRETFAKLATKGCIYRETIPYETFESKSTKLARIRREQEQESRVCMRYGCQFEGTFKEVENNQRKELKKPNCWYHPGVFDFGRKESRDETGSWKPHWTCCIKPWNAKGCKHTYHWGPVESELKQNPPKNGKWPEVSAMKNFKKEGSQLWRDKFAEYTLDEESASLVWKRFNKNQEKMSVSQIQELCDLFKLNLMAMSEDLSYHFKFMDVQSGRVDSLLDPQNSGDVTREAFLKWWFLGIEEYPIQFDEY